MLARTNKGRIQQKIPVESIYHCQVCASKVYIPVKLKVLIVIMFTGRLTLDSPVVDLFRFHLGRLSPEAVTVLEEKGLRTVEDLEYFDVEAITSSLRAGFSTTDVKKIAVLLKYIKATDEDHLHLDLPLRDIRRIVEPSLDPFHATPPPPDTAFNDVFIHNNQESDLRSTPFSVSESHRDQPAPQAPRRSHQPADSITPPRRGTTNPTPLGPRRPRHNVHNIRTTFPLEPSARKAKKKIPGRKQWCQFRKRREWWYCFQCVVVAGVAFPFYIHNYFEYFDIIKAYLEVATDKATHNRVALSSGLEAFKTASVMRVDDDNLLDMDPGFKEEWKEMKKYATQINFLEPSFCLDWAVESDRWWTHNPEWEISKETDEFYCFHYNPMEYRYKSNNITIADVYFSQFHGNCTHQLPWRMFSSGWNADTLYLEHALWASYSILHRPLQITQFPWHYAAPDAVDGKDNKGLPSAVEACPTRNINCFFLNISNCPPLPKETTETIPREDLHDYQRHQHLLDYLRFLRRFTLRPQLWLRKKIRSFVQEQIQKNGFRDETPCTAIHVRRGDVILDPNPSRKYYPIAAYLNASESIPGAGDPRFQLKDQIFLLTDDANAIGEAKTFFPGFHWMYIDRPRFKADEGGWEHQVPSNDPIFEMVVLQSTFHLIQRCDSLVRSKSGFSDQLQYYMQLRNTTTQIANLAWGRPASEVYNSNNSKTKEVSIEGLHS